MSTRACGEYTYDNLLAITAIPVTDYDLGSLDWQLKPTIRNTAFSPPINAKTIVIGLQPAVTGGFLVPMKRDSGSVKDSESDSVAGRKHTVSVECEADERNPLVRDILLQLERTPSHLLLTFRNGVQGFASATIDTYQCAVDRSGGKTNVKFDLENLMGIQIITT